MMHHEKPTGFTKNKIDRGVNVGGTYYNLEYKCYSSDIVPTLK